MQAAQWPDCTWRSSGVTSAHSSVAMGQRGWNTQPVGGFNGLGTSPDRMMRSLWASMIGSGMGTADSNALV